MGVTTWKCQRCQDIQQSVDPDNNPPQTQPPAAACSAGGNHNWQAQGQTWTCRRCNQQVQTNMLSGINQSVQACHPVNGLPPGNHDWQPAGFFLIKKA